MVTTMEFYKKKNIVYVIYNNKEYTLSDFLSMHEAKKMITKMYFKILSDYHEEMKNKVNDNNNMGEVVGTFIKMFLLDKDRVFDVVYYSDGNVIKFNIEDVKKKNDD